MNKLFLLAILSLAAAASVPAQLVITSFNKNGQMTWTNVVSNAQYRVEWASSPTGAWQSFDALTNLTLLSASSNSVTVQVPTLYRVVWLNPPQPEPDGDWDYQAYDSQGVLVVTGRLSLVYQTNQSESITGTRDLQWSGNNSTSGYWRLQLGMGIVGGGLTSYDFHLNLNLETSDENIILRGRMIGTYLSGIWAFQGFAGGEEPMGTFVALKPPSQAAQSPHPPKEVSDSISPKTASQK